MKHHISRIAAFVLFATLASAQPKPASEAPDWFVNPPPMTELVTLKPIPAIQYIERPPLTDAEREEIRKSIDDLVQVSDPTQGLSSTMSGAGFSPLPKQGTFHAGLLTDHKFVSLPAFTRLVVLGPRALPQLLDALGDTRKTRLQMKHDFGMGVMAFDREIYGNPRNEPEWNALEKLPPFDRSDTLNKSLTTYDVTVGDVCFVIIGQIVGRDYLAVRYQPTACIVLNSPTHDPNLAEAVRQSWRANDPSRRLLDSLLIDFYSRGKTMDIGSLDLWERGATFQIPAATRLLYYFPEISAPLIAARLDELNVSIPKSGNDLESFMARTVENGTRLDDFLAAVSWSDRPEICDALNRIAERTNDPELKHRCARPKQEPAK